jgi:hypothetical protein
MKGDSAMHYRRSLSFLLLCASIAAPAQSFRSLAYIDKVPIPGKKDGYAVQLPMKCAPDGTLYVRFAEATAEPAVTLIQEDGKIASTIRLSAIPDFSENDLYDFSPANGQVLVLSGKGKPHNPTTYYISRFKIDGTYISSAIVDIGARPDFEPREIAAFSSGNLVLGGIAKGHDVPYVPFMGIFSEDGQLRREVSLKGDVSEEDLKQKRLDTQVSWAQEIRDFLAVTFVQNADDGNIYVMRHTPSGPVFVVSPGGAVRRIPLIPPAEHTDLQWVMASNGSIAAQYRSLENTRPKTHYLVSLDALTSKTRETVRYTFDYENNGGGMACYQDGAFTFLAGAPNGGLQLVRAIPR